MSDEEETGEIEELSEQEMARNLVDTAFAKVIAFNGLTADMEAVATAREVIKQMDPEIMVRLADIDKEGISDKDKLETCEQILGTMVSKDGERMKYRWGRTKDATNPASLFRNEEGEWELLLDVSLGADNIEKLPGEIMHEYGAWLMLTDGGVQEKDDIPMAVTSRTDDNGKAIKYASTHLVDLTYRNVVTMKKEID